MACVYSYYEGCKWVHLSYSIVGEQLCYGPTVLKQD